MVDVISSRRGRLVTFCCCALLGVVLSAGCGGRTAAPVTKLTLLAVNPYAGRAVFHIACDPPGGDLGNPARVCSALATDPDLVTHPKPFVCYGGLGSWWDVTIRGRLHGRTIRAHTGTCWTPQMAMIRRLGIGWRSLRAHLLPRRREAVLPGVPRTFAGGLLRPADLVTCEIRGHALSEGVPIEFGTSSTGFGGKEVTSVVLRVTHERDGSVSASCGLGNA